MQRENILRCAIVAIAATSLAACSIDSGKVQGPEPRQFKKTNFDRPAPEEGDVSVEIPVTPFTPEEGGAPGKILLMGAIAKIATQIPLTGSKVRYLASHGRAKDGSQPEVAQANRPLVVENPSAGSFGPADGQYDIKLLAFGCDGRDLSPYTSETPASTDRIDRNFFTEQVKNLRADQIILCGENPLSATKNIFLAAREIIVIDSSFSFVGPESQTLVLVAKTLELVGRNVWHSKPAATTPADRRSIVHIAIADKVEDENGSLDVIAEGKDYVERIEGR